MPKGFQKGHPVYGGLKTRFKKGCKPVKPWKKGHKPWNIGLPADKQPFAGKKHTEKYKNKMRIAHLGEKHFAWKGDGAGYKAIHYWVSYRKGKAKKCVDCGTTEGKIEWSNVDHKYRRNVNDYKSRCVKCHRMYDHTIVYQTRLKAIEGRLMALEKNMKKITEHVNE